MDAQEGPMGPVRSTGEVMAMQPSGGAAPRTDRFEASIGAGARELVDRATRGDVEAFERLVHPHVASLYRLAAAMVGPEEARDVTQDTLVSAWRELGRLRQADRLEAWLRSILMNRARNALRTRRRHPSVTFEPEAGHGDRLHHEPIPALHGHWAVEEALAGLPPEHRSVVVLHYLADLPMRQVAETLGLREGTARSRLHAALQSLRRHFEEAGA
jgi:RNA polymerase sigma-70 factor, ECF subfamily